MIRKGRAGAGYVRVDERIRHGRRLAIAGLWLAVGLVEGSGKQRQRGRIHVRRRGPYTSRRVQAWRESESVYLQVLDEGGGIPPADLEHIFDKFYRAQKGDHVRAGTGLGLAISRGFVEAMHGTIVAENRPDRAGAVFTIRLPVTVEPRQLDTAA